MPNKKISSLIRLIRIPNLVIIILTQVLLRYCIVKPLLYTNAPEMISGNVDFFLLVIVTVLIATGGYIINDYFDIFLGCGDKWHSDKDKADGRRAD